MNLVPNNKIKITDAIDVAILHNRKIVYHPENFLLVIDTVASTEVHSYSQWFTINPELTITSEGLQFFLSSKNNTPIAIIKNLAPANSLVSSESGVIKPRLQGWVSLDGHTLEKSESIRIKSQETDCVIATVFDLNPTDKGTYFFNEGTKGKYLRFTLKRSESRFDFISRIKTDFTEITFDNNGQSSQNFE